MAYTPTRADFIGADMGQPKSGGYRPTRADFMQQEEKPQESHWWNSVGEKKNDLSDRSMYSMMRQQSPFGPSHNPDPGKGNYNMGEKVGEFGLDMLPWLVPGTAAEKMAVKGLTKAPALAAKVAEFAASKPKTAKLLNSAAQNIGTGAAYSSVNAEPGKRGDAAITGGIYGGFASLAPYPVNWAAQYGAKKYAQSAIPEFTKKATDKLRELLPLDAAAQKLENLYKKSIGKNKDNWTGLKKSAKELDQNVLQRTPEERQLAEVNKLGKNLFDTSSGDMPTVAKSLHEADSRYFNQSPYLDYIGKYQDKIKGLEPSIKAPYEQSIGVASKVAEMAPESFSGAVSASKNINQKIKDHLSDGGKAINPANRESQQFLSGLKDTIRNDLVDANKDKVGAEALGQFKNQWEAANKSHQDVLKFHKSPEKMTGVVPDKEQRTLRAAFKASLPEHMGGQNVSLDPSIFGRYMPSLTDKGAKGIEGFNQLSKVLGSKKEARDIAKAYIFQGQINNGAKTVDAAAQHAKLSDSQKRWLFGNSEEGRLLEAINKTRLAFDREPNKKLDKIFHGFASWTAPGLLAGGASYVSGDSPEKSATNALLATIASKGLGKIAGKTATEKSVARALRMKDRVPGNGKYINLVTQNLLNSRQDN